jgi:signal transduction histidine kinase
MQTHLLEQWRAFTAGERVEPFTLRPVTLAAWNRCRDLGIALDRLQYRFLSEQELATRREQNASLLEAARPYLDYLSMALSDRSHAIALADREGWIIEFREHPRDTFGGEASGICLGSSWNERHIGNNGIGTALATGEPVLVYGIEHCVPQFHSAYCLGVPIRSGGEIIGALDISVTRPEDASPSHMTIAQACVASIESTLGAWRRNDQEQSDLRRFAGLGRLLATTVHDLKGPLTVIRGIAQLGDMTSRSENERQYFREIVSHSDRLEGMIEGIQSMPHEPEFVAASPGSIMSALLDEFVPACEAKGIAVERELDCEATTAVVPSLLERAIANIVSNAIRATPSGGRIKARARSEVENILLSISDTGRGIPEELGETIFDPFVRGKDGGSGLGLYMAWHTVVELHGGNITFVSTAGSGTTFEITLPVRSVPGSPQTSAQPPAHGPGGGAL